MLAEFRPNKLKETLALYGTINVRTDGEKDIIAQKLEQHAALGNCEIQCLNWISETNEFEYTNNLK